MPVALLAWTPSVPANNLPAKQGWDSSCHTECRSPSLDRVRDLSLYEQVWSFTPCRKNETLIEQVKRNKLDATPVIGAHCQTAFTPGGGAFEGILYIDCFVP
ncbi:MAG TPA: hypothetical protein VN901_31105 [Candidatus Acidoferrales bacterium]|nr:hypothetical protein [Candidatus Acidoferrales bacterium]